MQDAGGTCVTQLSVPLAVAWWAALLWWTPTASAGKASLQVALTLNCAKGSLRSSKKWPKAHDWACVSASTSSASTAGTAPTTTRAWAKSYSKVSFTFTSTVECGGVWSGGGDRGGVVIPTKRLQKRTGKQLTVNKHESKFSWKVCISKTVLF